MPVRESDSPESDSVRVAAGGAADSESESESESCTVGSPRGMSQLWSTCSTMWRDVLLSRCLVARSAVQLVSLQEFAILRGSFNSGNPRAARAGLSRGFDIVAGLPDGSGSPLAHAALRLCASGSEGTLSFTTGAAFVDRAHALSQGSVRRAPAAAAAALPSDFDTSGGFKRAAAAEASLAWARLALVGAAGSAGGGAAAAAAPLASSLAASAAIEEELRFVEGPGEATAAVALLPNALAHARANALRILVSALQHQGGSATSSAKGDGAAAAAPVQRAEGPAACLALTLNACGSLEDIVRRALPPPSPASAPRYLHLRAQAVRASAHQNMASAHLLASADARAAAAAAAAATYSPASLAQSLLSAAHEQLEQALEVGEGALKGAEEGLQAAAAVVASAGGSVERSRMDVWRRLVWDLRAAKAEILISRGEVGLLTVLEMLWGASGSSGDARGEGPIFPLSVQDAKLAAPVILRVWEGAGASLKVYEALEAAGADSGGGGGGGGGSAAAAAGSVGGAAGAPLFCERGADFGVGAGRALRLLGVLNCFEGKSVTAEGAFRAVLDRYAALGTEMRASGAWPAAPTTATAGPAAAADLALAWRDLPVPYQAHLAATLQPYGALLSQWDKREREAAGVQGAARALLSNAVGGWRGAASGTACLGDAAAGRKAEFLLQATHCAAITCASVGSWGLGLPQDLADI